MAFSCSPWTPENQQRGRLKIWNMLEVGVCSSIFDLENVVLSSYVRIKQNMNNIMPGGRHFRLYTVFKTFSSLPAEVGNLLVSFFAGSPYVFIASSITKTFSTSLILDSPTVPRSDSALLSTRGENRSPKISDLRKSAGPFRILVGLPIVSWKIFGQAII